MISDGTNALLAVIRELAFARDLEGVTSVVRTSARRLTRADGVTFVLKEQGNCYYADEDAIAPLWKGRRFPLETCISGWVMLHKAAAIVPDIYADERIPHSAYRPTFVRSLVMTPVRRDDPIAAIGAYWAEPHAATPEEVHVLEMLADAAALALANVQLYRDLEASVARERAAREQADQASVIKDQFLATVSHELRTPLQVLQGWIWQLDHLRNDPERFTHAVEVLKRNVRLQSRLVEDLLDVSAGLAGKLALENETLDLAALSSDAIAAAAAEAQSKGIRLTHQAEPSVLVHGDQDRIQQILSNLLSNAIKFTPRGGTVLISAGYNQAKPFVRVEDSGVGIAPGFMPFVFDRFRQADATTTRQFRGLGIGLTLVKQLAAMHGAEVRAESEGEDRGTRVTVEFPAPAAHPASTSTWPRSARVGGSVGAGSGSGQNS